MGISKNKIDATSYRIGEGLRGERHKELLPYFTLVRRPSIPIMHVCAFVNVKGSGEIKVLCRKSLFSFCHPLFRGCPILSITLFRSNTSINVPHEGQKKKQPRNDSSQIRQIDIELCFRIALEGNFPPR